MYIVIIAIFGLIVGSLLNVIIFRLKSGDKIVWARSKCLHCGHQLSAADLVPILSYVFLRAKCRYCHKKIDWQYPAVEGVTAVIFVLGYLKFLSPVLTVANLPAYLIFLFFSGVLLVIFVYDLKYYLILDEVTLPAWLFAFLANWLLGFSIFSLLLASLVLAGFFLFQFILSKGKWIGGGDIRLGLVMGAMLGWPMVLVALLLSYITGAAVSLGLLVFKQKSWGDQIPFGTFLTLATVVVLLYGEVILRWYLTKAHLL